MDVFASGWRLLLLVPGSEATPHVKGRHVLPGTTVRCIAPVVCDVLAEFPRHFDRVFLVTGAMESSAMIPAGSVDVT